MFPPPGFTPPSDPRRRAFGEEFALFMNRIKDVSLEPGDPTRRAVVARYRLAVETAAFHGIEVALMWSALAAWTESGKERVGFFSRALDCQLAANKAKPPSTPKENYSDTHLRGECLFEIGRIHFHEGDPTVARDFFERALPLARAQEEWASKCHPPIAPDNRLEGKILELLLQLPEEGEGLSEG